MECLCQHSPKLGPSPFAPACTPCPPRLPAPGRRCTSAVHTITPGGGEPGSGRGGHTMRITQASGSAPDGVPQPAPPEPGTQDPHRGGTRNPRFHRNPEPGTRNPEPSRTWRNTDKFGLKTAPPEKKTISSVCHTSLCSVTLLAVPGTDYVPLPLLDPTARREPLHGGLR